MPLIDINIGNYVSLNNEITIKDLGEGLERAIQNTGRSRMDGVRCDRAFDGDAGGAVVAGESSGDGGA
jgi:hypothetical protein